MKIIPAVDIRGGRCVRLLRGDFGQETVFSDDPPAVARRWAELGAELVHVVDLDGARTGRLENRKMIIRMLDAGVPVQVGGGIRSREAARDLLSAGVQRIILGTAAVKRQGLLRELREEFGSRVLVGVDCRRGRVAVHGWRTDSGRRVGEFCRELVDMGIGGVIVTDIGRDGMLSGPNTELLREVLDLDLRVIASGGVGSVPHLNELRRLALRHPNLEGVIIGRALYDGSLSPESVLGARDER